MLFNACTGICSYYACGLFQTVSIDFYCADLLSIRLADLYLNTFLDDVLETYTVFLSFT